MLSILLKANPNYDTQVTLDGNLFNFAFRWIELESAWYLDIAGVTNTDFAVNGLRLCGGVDLVEPHGLLDFGELWCIDLSGQSRDPEFDNISTDFVLFYR